MQSNTLIDLASTNEDSAGEMPVFSDKKNRLIKKRRPQSKSFSHTGPVETTQNANIDNLTNAFHGISMDPITANKLPFGKNSRKSRQGFKYSSRKENSRDILFRKYDELEEFSAGNESEELDHVFEREEIDRNVAEERICDLLYEFYNHVNFFEFYSSIKELNIPQSMRKLFPLFVINFAMQHRSLECEFTSELLAYLYKKFISPAQMAEGFTIVLNEMYDIILDVPKAPVLVGRFIARAISDGLISNKFLQNIREMVALDSQIIGSQEKSSFRSISESSEVVGGNSISSSAYGSLGTSLDSNDHVLKAISTAENILAINESFMKLHEEWGEKCGQRANRFFVLKFQLLIRDFISREDVEEVNEVLLDLNVPHFHHELVYQILMSSLEKVEEKEIDSLLNLLKKLCDSVTITKNQLEIGVNRVFNEMPLIDKEMPCAYIVLNRLMKKAYDKEIISEKMFKSTPQKNGRKRFVSEGDFLTKSNCSR